MERTGLEGVGVLPPVLEACKGAGGWIMLGVDPPVLEGWMVGTV